MDLLSINDADGEYPPSYYAACAKKLDRLPRAEGDLRCDVCIVGAGFTGLSSALHLAQKGFHVIVVEAQRVGFGASGRNGGQVGSGQRRNQVELENMFGPARARDLWDIASSATELVKTFSKSNLMNCQFVPGIIHADHRKRMVKGSHDYARKLQEEYGYKFVRPVGKDEVRYLVASQQYYGGMVDLGSGHLDPLEFALGLARMAIAAGAQIHEGSRAIRVHETAQPCVETAHAKIRSDFIVLACNGYAMEVGADSRNRVMPVNNFIVATEKFEKAGQEEIIRNNYAVADSRFVVNYFRFSPEGRLLFGGGESYGYRFPNDIAKVVRRPLLTVFPQLENVRIDYSWGGVLAISTNRLPCFERRAGNILTMCGYSGHGLAMASMAGRIAADAIAGQAEHFDLMASLVKKPFPGGSAARRPILALAMLWYSLRDRF